MLSTQLPRCRQEHRAYYRRDSFEIRIAHGRPRGQTQPVPEERLGHTSPLPRREGPGEGHLVACKHRLQVHRLPEGTGLDVLPLQRQADGRARGAELRGIHGESAEQVVSVTALADQKLRQGGYVWYSAGGSATSTFAA